TLNGLPLQDIAEGLDRNLAASEGALQEIAATADRLEKLLGGPDMQRLPGRLNDTLSTLEDTLDGLSAGGDGRQIGDTLQRLEKVLRDVEPVLRTLRQQPNALIFQHDPPADPVPKAQPHD
ncbi:MAG TPA: mammalian cell entry protein, partial [Alcanivorax sp.]|nr:mammalian cell entry protein [Alcanivorax sp.]